MMPPPTLTTLTKVLIPRTEWNSHLVLWKVPWVDFLRFFFIVQTQDLLHRILRWRYRFEMDVIFDLKLKRLRNAFVEIITYCPLPRYQKNCRRTRLNGEESVIHYRAARACCPSSQHAFPVSAYRRSSFSLTSSSFVLFFYPSWLLTRASFLQ